MNTLYEQAGPQKTDYPVDTRIPKPKSLVHITRSLTLISNPTSLVSPDLPLSLAHSRLHRRAAALEKGDSSLNILSSHGRTFDFQLHLRLVIGKVTSGNPLLEELIELGKGSSLGLWDEEIAGNKSECTEPSEQESCTSNQCWISAGYPGHMESAGSNSPLFIPQLSLVGLRMIGMLYDQMRLKACTPPVAKPIVFALKVPVAVSATYAHAEQGN